MLSWPAVALGLVALAALLFALQRLRARPRVVALAGAWLWQAAAGAAPRRVLFDRFHRWLAYLLALAIASALWVAFAQPEWRAAGDARRHVFFLDASAAMTAPDRFAAARRALLADVATLPRADRTVVLGGPTPALLLAPGEDVAVLRGRLARVAPGIFPSTFADWQAMGGALDGADRRPMTLHYYGPDDVAPPPGARLVTGYRAPPIPGNRGIVALGVSPAASGTAGRADVLVRTAAAGVAPGAGDLRFTLDGRRLDANRARTIAPGTLLLTDVPAAGGRLHATLAGNDGFAADDSATIAIPDRRPVRVAIADGVPDAIRRVVSLDPALRIVAPGDAQVIVRRAGQAVGRTLPAFEIADPGAQTDAFAITDPAGDDDAVLARAIDGLGVTQIDAGRLADDLSRPVAVAIARGPQRRVGVWADVFAPGSAFVQSRAMPLFVSQSLHWLAGSPPWLSYASAGRPLPTVGADGIAAGRDLPFPLAAGDVQVAGRSVPVSLTAPAVTRGVAAPARMAAAGGGWMRFPDPLAQLLLAVALLLLAVEWVLLAKRRIP